MTGTKEVSRQTDAPASQQQPVAVRQTDHLVPPIIAKALIAIQKELKPLIKSAENEAFASSYVPLDVVTETAHQLLAAKKIAVMQPMVTDDQGHAALETILIYEDGRSFSRTTKLAMNKVDPQAHGSAVTYTRRYALMAMIGLTAKDEDDDGNKATGVYAPVRQDQQDELDSMLLHLKFSPKQRAAEIFKIKTADHAALALDNFRKMIAMKRRDDESKANATKIEVGDGEADSVTDLPTDPVSLEALQQRITALGLKDKGVENKLVNRLVGKPFLHLVKKQSDRQSLSDHLQHLENGAYSLPAEFYPPASEPRTVNEDVA